MRADAHRPEDDPGWPFYTGAILYIRAAPVQRIDLREPPPPGLAAQLAGAGLPPAFAIVTAENPGGRDRDPARDRARTLALGDRLRREGVAHIQADGASPDGSHVERGFAIALDRAVAAALARELGQTAIYWFDGERFWLDPALADAEPVPLPVPGG